MANRQFGPLEAMMYVQQQGETGKQQGQNTRLAKLVSQGMTEPGGLERVVPEVASFNPDAAFKIQDRASSQMDKRRDLLTSRARILSAMPPQQKAQVWPSMKAELAAVDPELGAALPDMYDEAQFGPVIQQLAGLTNDIGPKVLSPGAAMVDGSGKLIYQNPAIPTYSVQEGTNPDGSPRYFQIPTKGAAPGSAVPVAIGGGGPQMAPPQQRPQPGSGGLQPNSAEDLVRQIEAVEGPLDPQTRAQIVADVQRNGGRFDSGSMVPPAQQPATGGGFGQTDEQRAAAKAAEATGVTEGEGLAKQGLERIDAIRQKAVLASTQSASLDELERLLTQAYTGPGANTMLSLGKLGTVIGVGDGEQVSAAEAAQAISNRLALSLRNPAGGEGMPGAMSDADRAFLQSSIPSLQNTPGGWKQMIDFQRKLNKAAIDQAREVERYLAAGGKPRDVYAHMQEYAERNSIFPQAGQQSAGQYSQMSDEELKRELGL